MPLFLLTRVASTEGFLVATIAMLILFVFQRDRRSAVALFASAAGLILTVQLLKEALRVPRPVETLIEVTGYSFPSGHAAGSFFLALVVAFLCRNLDAPVRYLSFALCALAALSIAGSRIAYHVHTPLQVIVGAALGIFFALVFIRFSTEPEDAR